MRKLVVVPLYSFLGWLSLKVCRSLALQDLVRLFSVRLRLARCATRSLHAPVGNHHPRSRAVGCGLSDAF